MNLLPIHNSSQEHLVYRQVDEFNNIIPTSVEIEEIRYLCEQIHLLCRNVLPSELFSDILKKQNLSYNVVQLGSSLQWMDCIRCVKKERNNNNDSKNHDKYLQSMEELQKYCVSLVKILQQYPRLGTIVDILHKYNIKWSKLPKRNFKGELLRAYNYWIEEEPDATQSSLFSSVGIWTSPSLPFQNFIHGCIWCSIGLLFIVVSLATEPSPFASRALKLWYAKYILGRIVRERISFLVLGIFFFISGINNFCMSWTLYGHHNRKLAKLLMLIQSIGCLIFFTVVTIASSCDGCFGNGFFANEGSIRPVFYAVHGIARGGGALMLVICPKFSFYTLYIGTTLESLSWIIFLVGSDVISGTVFIILVVISFMIQVCFCAHSLYNRNEAIKKGIVLPRSLTHSLTHSLTC